MVVTQNIYINHLIQQGENQRLDFKFEVSNARKIAKSLVAFANSGGGTLLVGVKDNGVVAGIRTEEEYYMIDAAAKIYCKPEINYIAKNWTISGKTILEVQVTPEKDIHYFAKTDDNKWMAYVRSGDKNILANSVLLKVWRKAKTKDGIFLSWSMVERSLLSYLENFQTITLSQFCRVSHITRKMAEDVLSDLIVLDLIDIHFTEKQVYYTITKKGKARVEND